MEQSKQTSPSEPKISYKDYYRKHRNWNKRKNIFKEIIKYFNEQIAVDQEFTNSEIQEALVEQSDSDVKITSKYVGQVVAMLVKAGYATKAVNKRSSYVKVKDCDVPTKCDLAILGKTTFI